MLQIVLYQPEIPPNTGNIIRLCANTGFQLHLIRPLGFDMDDKKLRRAGLDYQEWQTVTIHNQWQDYLDAAQPKRIFGLSTKGHKFYNEIEFQDGDAMVFGPETRGLPQEFLKNLGSDHILRVPMLPQSRSLNLSNTAAIVAYEAWRQQGFPNAQ